MKDHDSIEKESRVGEIPGICFGDQDSERERDHSKVLVLMMLLGKLNVLELEAC